MKISVNISKENKKQKFPGLYLSKSNDAQGLVVLFTSYSEGIIVNSDSQDWRVGDNPRLNCYQENWTYLPAGSSCTFTQE